MMSNNSKFFDYSENESFASNGKDGICTKGYHFLEVIKDVTHTKPGSLKYLLFGSAVSKQSISVKFGKWGEKWFEYLVEITPNFTMLPHGVLKGIGSNGKNKDVDFLFEDEINKIIYYRELKGNIDLDTEKLPATVDKINYLKEYLEKKYPEHTVNYGCLNWSVWDKKIYELKENISFLRKIKLFENGGVTVTHASEIFEILGIDFTEADYYNYMKELGKKLNATYS